MLANLPTNVDISRARLPATYEQAKVALASCERIDECKDWADKAEALATYAKMADDDTLRALADRIQARAVRRMGELLKDFDGRGSHWGSKRGDAHISTRAEVSKASGVSRDQAATAIRVANIPAEQFDAVVESDKPPSVTALAEMGKKRRPLPEGFKPATHLISTVKRFAEFCQQNDAALVAGGVMSAEAAELRSMVAIIDGWLDRFIIILKG